MWVGLRSCYWCDGEGGTVFAGLWVFVLHSSPPALSLPLKSAGDVVLCVLLNVKEIFLLLLLFHSLVIKTIT